MPPQHQVFKGTKMEMGSHHRGAPLAPLAHLSEAVQGLKASCLAHVAVQLGRRGQPSQAKQDLGTVGTLLGAEEHDGAAAAEAAGTQSQQDCLALRSPATLQQKSNLLLRRWDMHKARLLNLTLLTSSRCSTFPQVCLHQVHLALKMQHHRSSRTAMCPARDA